MNMSNTKIVVGPKELSDYLEKSPQYFKLIKTFDLYKVFETRNTPRAYVTPLKTEVYAINDLSLWKKTSEKWYGEYSEKSPFIVYDPDRDQKQFPLYNPKNTSSQIHRDDCQVREFIDRETIKIYTNCIGRPLLVKFAYHQNWQVTGADKVYLATPAFMIIVPKQSEVTLHYGKKTYNYVSYACGILGLILLFTYGYIETWLLRQVTTRYKKHKKMRAFCQRIARRYQLKKRREKVLLTSMPVLCTLVLLLSIAFVYTNKG